MNYERQGLFTTLTFQALDTPHAEAALAHDRDLLAGFVEHGSSVTEKFPFDSFATAALMNYSRREGRDSQKHKTKPREKETNLLAIIE